MKLRGLSSFKGCMSTSSMLKIRIVTPQSAEAFQRYFDLRWRILRKPWGQPPGSERDRHEKEAIHVMACDAEGTPIGIGRLHLLSDNKAQIRFMAVEERFRRQGIGSAILAELERRARALGIKRIVLNARASEKGFYERQGYRCIGRGPTLFGAIRHHKMVKDLMPREAP
ncbi:MAG: GNAT family N-acetyltransferase [Gammaproteobacteria bacterium]|nr:MAG: GNAT family N-acetyltransferase [Gammaproteobacteria bacterium]